MPVRQPGRPAPLFSATSARVGRVPGRVSRSCRRSARSSREAGRAAPGPSISGCSAAASLLAAPPGTGRASGKAQSGRPGAMGWPRAFPLREPRTPLVFARAAGLADGQRGGGEGCSSLGGSGLAGARTPLFPPRTPARWLPALEHPKSPFPLLSAEAYFVVQTLFSKLLFLNRAQGGTGVGMCACVCSLF